MRFLLKNKVQKLYPDAAFDILIPPDEKLGDYSINLAFVLNHRNTEKGGKIGNPEKIGQELIENFRQDKDLQKYFSKIELAGGGFINFYLSQDFLQKQLLEIHKHINNKVKKNGKTVIVEYSSPNIAKPMHIGHLRSTIIGDALANVYEELGYEVIRWNYIGDWGTAVGKLIVAYKDLASSFGKDEADKQFFGSGNTLGMVGNYVKYHQTYEDDEKAREEFKKLENQDKDNVELWERICKFSLQELWSVYASIGISISGAITKGSMFFRGESYYEPKLKILIQDLIKKGIAKESEGALIIELENLPPTLLRKSDGATLYITRDIASLEDRIKNYNPEKILYVVANQQTLHFQQLFAVAHKLKLDSPELIHVKFGMVLGEDGKKLATREGKVVPLLEVVNKIQDKARGFVKHVKLVNKEISDDEAQGISRAVGIAALKYNDLKQHPHTDIVFDWDAMLDLRGNSGPYLQYTYARLFNIRKQVKNLGEGDTGLLVEPTEIKIIKKLLDFPDVILECSKFYALNPLALYLYELVVAANRFYEEVRVLKDENKDRRNARLMLVETTADILKKGLNLLGIEVLERI